MESRRLSERLWSGVRQNYHMGFTSFGGPPVHFKIFHEKYVQKLQWIDEQLYQELFSICQAFSGPASTKMQYCINLIHDGVESAIVSFFLWCLPGALGMYGLSIGVHNIGNNLPMPVYALLSGMNAATVGIIALAAVQLSEKAITDKLTRILVFLSASAGLLYNALWYFPLLMAVSGIATIINDFRWLHRPVRAVVGFVATWKAYITRQPRQTRTMEAAADSQQELHRVTDQQAALHSGAAEAEVRTIPQERQLPFSWKFGLGIIVCFLVSFIVVMVVRGTVQNASLLFSFFSNMYLAGTIIFGGGPVVIPLLREYVVAQGWVSPRDFLIGLAIQQGFPGPNFNFAVYLGSLTAINGGFHPALGALVGFVAMFGPGLVTVHGTMGIWSAVRSNVYLKSGLRGLNAAAVGLVYTAVYRVWQVGFVDRGIESGSTLGSEPWFVVVTASSYVGGYWFGVGPPVAIVGGAVLGLLWHAVVAAAA